MQNINHCPTQFDYTPIALVTGPSYGCPPGGSEVKVRLNLIAVQKENKSQ